MTGGNKRGQVCYVLGAYLWMAAKRSSVVRAREGIGVTMISLEPPLVVGAGDDSAVLESNTSPEKEMVKLTQWQNSKRQTMLAYGKCV